MSGQQQAGEAWFGGRSRAAVWSGSAASFVDLHPSGAVSSAAHATDGARQGGSAFYNATGYHALLWSGSAQSAIDLTPLSALFAEVFAMAPGQQAGYAEFLLPGGGYEHAGVWNGTAASFVDLNPPGYLTSRIYGTCGSAQVGLANSGGSNNGAGIWFNTPGSFISLHPFLPPGQYFQSVATCVTEYNGLFYVGGYARNAFTNRDEAFLWISVPAPGSIAGLLLGAGVLGLRRRR